MPHLVQNVYLRSDIPAGTGPVKVVKKNICYWKEVQAGSEPNASVLDMHVLNANSVFYNLVYVVYLSVTLGCALQVAHLPVLQ